MMKVLIAGGAGFIGSNLARKFLSEGANVTIIDGFVKETGANINNLNDIKTEIKLIGENIEKIKPDSLKKIVDQNDLLIDCMGWTRHNLAMDNPEKDLDLNCNSHLALIKALPGKTVFFLGSRGQYGNPRTKKISEDTNMVPQDIQGIHKLTAENYFRIYSNKLGFNVASLRLSNVFGPGQPASGKDIGLVGEVIQTILSNKTVYIYGKGRFRPLIFIEDLTEMVFKLSKQRIQGFNAYNIGGEKVTIERLVNLLIQLSGTGKYKIKKLPEKIKATDIESDFDDRKIKELVGKIQFTPIDLAMKKTLNYFLEFGGYDLQMRPLSSIQKV